jgi:hypothetical protein
MIGRACEVSHLSQHVGSLTHLGSKLLPTFIGFLIQGVSLARRAQTDGIAGESPAIV